MGLILKEKIHWLTEGINTNIKLPIKNNYKSYVPQISTDNNFAIDFKLYKQFFKNFNYNDNYSDNSILIFLFLVFQLMIRNIRSLNNFFIFYIFC